MVRYAPVLVVAVGCGFSPSGLAPDDGDARPPDASTTSDGTPLPIDAAAIDAPPPFDPSTCPGSYGDEQGRSRYRRIGNDSDVVTQHNDCNDDSDGLTHLFVPSNAAEVDALRDRLCPGAACRQHWVGVFAFDGVNYQTVTGETPYFRWDSGEPQDFDTPPTVVEFNAGDDAMIDLSILSVARYPAICECDGQAPSGLPSP